MTYEPKTFDLPELHGISSQTIEEHLGLYQGYVKHVNLIHKKIAELKDNDDEKYALNEMRRRLGFEYGGMKNHEYYFTQFEGGAKACPDGALKTMLEQQFGSVDDFVLYFKKLAKTRGVGWAMLYFDKDTEQLVSAWVDEQQLGQLADADIVLALDMWEHSYMLDYAPSKKADYIDAFFTNLNWEVVAQRV